MATHTLDTVNSLSTSADLGITPIAKLVVKLVEVMQAVEFVPKRGHNDYHHYDYATEADIVTVLRDELAKRCVILLPSVSKWTREPVGDKGSVLTHLDMEFTFIDGESGAMLTRPWLGAGTDKEDKGAYKAMTGGEKYFLLKTFLLPTGDDPEQEPKQERGGRQSRRRQMAARNSAPTVATTGAGVTSALRPNDSVGHAVIDGTQQKRLIDAAKQAGWTKAALQTFITDNYGAWSRVPAADFETVLLTLSRGIDAVQAAAREGERMTPLGGVQ